MSTRGCFGLHYKGRDYIVFNPSDSYPERLGKKVKLEAAALGSDLLKKAADKIKLVRPEDSPSVQQLAELADAGFYPPEKGANWRQTILYGSSNGISLSSWATGGLKYMPDDSDFLLDDVMCEWAYIANLDTEKLEIYAGNTTEKELHGRYVAPNGRQLPDNVHPTFGVHLVAEIPFADLGAMPDKKFTDIANGKNTAETSANKRNPDVAAKDNSAKEPLYIIASMTKNINNINSMSIEAVRNKNDAKSLFSGIVAAGFTIQGLRKDENGLSSKECIEKGEFSSQMIMAKMVEKSI